MWDDHAMRFPNRHLLTSGMLAATLLALGAMVASAASPVKITNCVKATSHPKLLTLTCGDGNTVLSGLRWSSFGGTRARARGKLKMNTCTPNCAQGRVVSYPVAVKVGD